MLKLLLSVLEVVAYCLPLPAKKLLEKAVFLDPQEKLPSCLPSEVALLVLGGGNPGDRAKRAAKLYKDGIAGYLVLTGGIGPYSLDRNKPEAAIDHEILNQHGIENKAIRVESQSRTTEENVKNSLAIIDELGVGHVIIVTSPWHVKRATMLFKRIAQARGMDSVKCHWSSASVSDGQDEPGKWYRNRKVCGAVLKEAIRISQEKNRRIN